MSVDTCYQLRIELQQIEPKIWRSLRAPASVTLAKLHKIFQIAMGWSDSHLHEFAIGASHYGIPDPHFDTEPLLQEKRVTLAEVLTPSIRRFLYSYDFGDGWEHDVLIERTVPLQPDEPPPYFALRAPTPVHPRMSADLTATQIS
jgi:hypothetical protein